MQYGVSALASIESPKAYYAILLERLMQIKTMAKMMSHELYQDEPDKYYYLDASNFFVEKVIKLIESDIFMILY